MWADALPLLSDRLPLDVQGAAALRARAARGDPKALEAAAKEFEAIVVQMMLKTMRATRLSGPDDPFAGDAALHLYRDLLDQHWAQRIAAGPGLGFADAMLRALRQREAVIAPPAPDENGFARRDADGANAPGMAQETPRQGEKTAAPSTAAPPGAPVAESDARADFLHRLWPHAEAAAARLGVPASFVLAHAALESGWGKSEPRHPDGRPSHNLFGIKAHRGWMGEAVENLTTEYRDGQAMKTVERFRAYPSYAEAFDDYARLLQRRYPDALAAGANPARFAAALARGGYATDPRYAEKLTAVLHGTLRLAAQVEAANAV